MDPVKLQEYSSEKRFVLYEAGAYTPLCSDVVVFRALGGMFAGPSVDLIFLGLIYFEMPNKLRAVRVWRPRDERARQFAHSFDTQAAEKLVDRLYAVETNGKRFHVIASKLWVHIHRELNRVSALTPLNDLNARDAYIQRYVKEWYEVE